MWPSLRSMPVSWSNSTLSASPPAKRGDSLVKRCSAVVMLRDAMGDAGLDAPIHIFGAINPMEVLTYFFCGADVFDGLNWLRLAFRKHGSIAIEEAAFEGQNSNLDDCDLRMDQRIVKPEFPIPVAGIAASVLLDP